MNIAQIRSDTAGCENIIHFNNAGAALMTKQVAGSIRDYITEEENNGGYEVADSKKVELDLFYEYAAQLLNCNKNQYRFYNKCDR